MAKTCPSCGYNPIGYFIDQCPLCAEPVRHVASDQAQGYGYADHGDADGGERPSNLNPWLIGGWIAILFVLAFFFSSDTPWMVLSLGICGAAWWCVATGKTLLVRMMGGSLLILFVPGFWLAAQPDALPGLDRRTNTPDQMLHELMNTAFRGNPGQLKTIARMKTISGAIYAFHAAVLLPLALIVPPMLSYAKRRKLGGPFWLTKPQAIGVLALWLLAVPMLAWSAWPAVRAWSEPSRFQAMQGFDANMMHPANRWKGKNFPVQNADFDDDDDGDGGKW